MCKVSSPLKNREKQERNRQYHHSKENLFKIRRVFLKRCNFRTTSLRWPKIRVANHRLISNFSAKIQFLLHPPTLRLLYKKQSDRKRKTSWRWLKPWLLVGIQRRNRFFPRRRWPRSQFQRAKLKLGRKWPIGGRGGEGVTMGSILYGTKL